MMIRTATLAIAAAAAATQAQSFASTSLDASASISVDTTLAADIAASVDAGFFDITGEFNFLFDDIDIPANDPLLATGTGSSQVVYDGSSLALEALTIDIGDVVFPPIGDSSSSSSGLLGTIDLGASLDVLTLQNTMLTLAEPTAAAPIQLGTGLVNPQNVALNIDTEIFFTVTISVDGTGLVPGIIGGLLDGLPFVISFDNSAITGDVAIPAPVSQTVVVAENFFLTATEEADELTVSSFFPVDETLIDIDALLFDAFGITTPVTLADIQTILAGLLQNGSIDQETFDDLQMQISMITDLADVDFALDFDINDLDVSFGFDATFDLGESIVEQCNAADINSDGLNNVFDAIEFLNLYNPAAPSPLVDINGDGENNVFDAIDFLNVYNPLDPNCTGN